MSSVIEAVQRQAQENPERALLHGDHGALAAAAVWQELGQLSALLKGNCLGILLDNGPAWALADLAALHAGICCVPLPLFFSATQLVHVIEDAGVDRLLVADPAQGQALFGVEHGTELNIAGERLFLFSRDGIPNKLPQGVAKVTYTSGTTGEPKGVCLQAGAMEQVATALASACNATEADRAIALTPLSTLLENIAGVYAPLLSGAEVHLPRMATVGLRGASALDVQVMLATLQRVRPSTMVLAPQMLQALVEVAEAGFKLPASLRFVAVGGAPVSVSLLERAEQQQIPVYEGYGLSEAASVVTLNTPAARRIGSVGRVLEHSSLQIAADGELLVGGSLYDGYLGDAQRPRQPILATGDLGYLDEDGYLYLRGKKKSIYITAFGRNVAPEWVERELLAQTAVGQAAVFGDGRVFSTAIIVPRDGNGSKEVQQALEQANQQLPDYAQVGRFILAAEPFSTHNRQLTGTGRPRRQNIQQAYREHLAAVYGETAA